MAKTPSKRRKPLVVLAVFLASWWLLPLPFKFYLRDAFHSFQAPIWDFGARIADLGEYWVLRTRSTDELIAAGRDAARLASGQQALAENERQLFDERERLLDLKADLERLRKDLTLSEPIRFKPVVARVIKREVNAWWQRMHLRKGELHGIREGDGVIFAGGVVGRIIETTSNSCVAQLATSPYFRIAANFRGDNRPVTFQGVGNHTFSAPFGVAKDAPTDVSPTATSPAELLTSPLSDIFPSGILIGKVPRLQTDPNGLFRTGRVEMDKRLLTEREVTVLIAPNRGDPR